MGSQRVGLGAGLPTGRRAIRTNCDGWCFLHATHEIDSEINCQELESGQVSHLTDGKTEVQRQGLCYWQAERLRRLKYTHINV